MRPASSRRILIGHDGGPHGADALALGRAFGELLGGSALVVAAETHDTRGSIDEGAIDADAQRLLGEVPFEVIKVIDGSADHVLHTLAVEQGASLIVFGSSGESELHRAVPGSVALRLLHGAPCAIAVAPEGYAQRGRRPPETIGVAYDGSLEAEVALRTAVGLARRGGCSLELLYGMPPSHYGIRDVLEVMGTGAFKTRAQRTKSRVLDLAVEGVDASVTARSRLVEGDTARAIADAAAELDLLVAGSRGRGPMRRVLLGSVSGGLAVSPSCPVLLLPRGPEPDLLGAAPGGVTSQTA